MKVSLIALPRIVAVVKKLAMMENEVVSWQAEMDNDVVMMDNEMMAMDRDGGKQYSDTVMMEN